MRAVNIRLRSALVSIHRQTGVLLGLILFVQGLTGAAMVFRTELNRSLHHAALTVVPAGATLPVQTLADQVRALHPSLHILRIEFPKAASEAFWFRLEAPGGGAIHYVSIDPYRGVVTRDGPLIAWPAHWLFELHEHLLLGPAGENLVGLEAVALLVLVIIGLTLWWPGRRHVRRSLQVKLNAGAYRGTRDLHRVAGVIVALVLVMSAATAMLVIWRGPVQSMLAHWTPITKRPAPVVAPRSDVKLLPVDALIAAARALYANAPIKSVRFPGGGHGRVVAVYFQASGTTRPRATDQVWFDGYTGQKLASYEAASVSSTTKVLDWALPVHTGQAFGITGRLVFLITALTLSALALTGLMQWFMRRRRHPHS